MKMLFTADPEFDQRRAYLDELLSLPHLWPEQVAMVRSLADEKGVRVVICDKELGYGDWRQREQ